MDFLDNDIGDSMTDAELHVATSYYFEIDGLKGSSEIVKVTFDDM